MRAIILFPFIVFVFTSCRPEQMLPNYAVKDYDGNGYTAVAIGKQTWLRENLKVRTFNDGKPIPLVTSNQIWDITNAPAYCWYNNDSVKYADPYGAMYTWYTVGTGKLCPVGWHVPTKAELDTFFKALGGREMSANKLKETGLLHWRNNSGATNESGFTALPGGHRSCTGGIFYELGENGFWWSSGNYNSEWAYGWGIYSLGGCTEVVPCWKQEGYSVRCIKD